MTGEVSSVVHEASRGLSATAELLLVIIILLSHLLWTIEEDGIKTGNHLKVADLGLDIISWLILTQRFKYKL